ncbi:FxsA family protein [Corynebacterium doosanense]|uniref:Exlusion protein FxsA n=1 Tax=Corynebacterium doosanense CAU 212 = DSM 45436 TaxID=558173 RepID=A0A097IG05_9CORY|nr:FxsA family protein [Corynebacterium doosanense]AIT61070.1 hypothetical protein CDOO_07255 [Corynebacterium doosanense CAU 212 = DSM 45436]
MPFALVVAYIALEAVVFYLVATWIGVGWALLAFFGLMIVGGLFGLSQLRSVTGKAAQAAQEAQEGGSSAAGSGQVSAGKIAGELGLIMVGTLLAATPGFVTGVVGLLFIFPPTRALLRKFVAAQVTKSVESFGTRMYTRSPMSQNHTNYGHFVIDEDPEELRP